MIDELNRIIDTINSKSDWGNNEKIRFAYVELGKLVHKDIFFFYTIQYNLLNGKEELQYDIDTIDRIINSEDNFDYKVICKNSADMLKYIFDHVGIESEIKRTTKVSIYKDGDKEVQINHYFIVATGDDDKKYFMTLNPDLPNIQIGKRTSHFANNIPYIQKETIENENGEKVEVSFQAYEGEKIDNSTMSPEEIRELDEKIGYQFINYNGEYVYTDELFDILESNYRYNFRSLNDGEYLDTIRCETPFYYDLCNLLNGNKTLSEILNSDTVPTLEEINDSFIDGEKLNLNENVLNDLKMLVLFEAVLKLYDRFNIEINDNILDEYRQLLKMKDYDSIQKMFNINFYDKNVTNLGPYNPIVQLKKVIKMMKNIDNLIGQEKTNDNVKMFIDSLKDIELIFVPDELLPMGEKLNSSYIINKIIKSFERIFDIGHIGEFNNLELAEQIAIIKEILGRVFTDTKLNSQDKSVIGYRDDKSPLANRVYSTVLFDKENNDPYYLMIVRNSLKERENNEGLVPILFDLKRNTLSTDKSMIEIYDSYFIIKENDFKLMIEQVEGSNMSK